jgi:hypothetical protein
MKKFLSIFGIVIGLIIIIGLSIWIGFPSPHFNRIAICLVGYFIGIALIFFGVGTLIIQMED